MTAAQNVPKTPIEAEMTVASLLAPDDPSLTTLPPTKEQVAYWRELAGVLHTHDKAGVGDDDWPADLKPSRPTLTALEERGIISRRKRAWRLTRLWYTRLGALVERAVPTPPLVIPDRPGAAFPTYAELERWEQVCRWLDAQPNRRSRLPFVGLRDVRPSYLADDLPLTALHDMRESHLVRHTAACEWALSPTWKQRLVDLWQGRKLALREYAPADLMPDETPHPRVVAAGLDTWYLNWLSDEALPPRLRTQLDDLQAQAREDENECDTPWVFDGAPLRMYRFGSSAAQSGGVSWGYILRNPSVAISIRKAPLGRVIAQVRLGAECLWRLTPRRALDELDALVKRLWTHTPGQWQVSQAHLAVDVVNAPITDDGLSRYVSRSRKQAVFAAARKEIDQLLHALRGDHATLDEDEMFGVDWDADYVDDDVDDFNDLDGGYDDPFADDETFGGVPRLSRATARAQANLETSLEDRRLTTYRLGRRFSGASWSVGGAVSFVLYDKTLQSRLTNRHAMEPIWAAAGRRPDERVTRHEGRLRREVFRELRLPGKVTPCLDDPWQFLDHLGDLWALLVGQPEEDCPDAVNVAWIRQVVPTEDDTNHSRWPTDPAWRVVQQATFTAAPAQARRLIRRKQQAADVQVLVKLNYGTLVSRTARLHPHGGQYDFSAAMGEIVPALMKEAANPDKDFGTLVRERRRKWGLPLPVQDKLLPFRSAPIERFLAPLAEDAPPLPQEPLGEPVPAGTDASWSDADAAPSDTPDTADDTQAALRLRRAEHRVQETLVALEAASLRGAPPWELRQWEQAYLDEMSAYEAADTVYLAAQTTAGRMPLDDSQPE